MPDLEVALSQMEEIIRWWEILGDVAETAAGVVGHRLSMTGVHGTPKDATESAVLQIDAVDTIQRDVEALAGKLGWRPRRDGDPKIYILRHLDWAATNLAPVEWVTVIADLHRRVGSITGHAPRPTGRQCPLCGETLRLIPPPRPTWQTVAERQAAAAVPDRFTCDGCQEERDADEIEALVKWRLSGPTATSTAHEAAKLLGVKAGTMRKRIFDRGLKPINKREAGMSLYYLKDLF